MTGMHLHGTDESKKRGSQILAQRWRDIQKLMGNTETAFATHAESFIQVDAKHAIRCFKLVDRPEVHLRLIAG